MPPVAFSAARGVVATQARGRRPPAILLRDADTLRSRCRALNNVSRASRHRARHSPSARVFALAFAMRRSRSILAATLLTLVFGAAAASDAVGARTALDLAGVVPRDDAVDPESTSSERFVPPAPDDPAQVVQLDANALFAALVNHTVRRVLPAPLRSLARATSPRAMSP
jgi:hypothetical protein